MSKSKREKRLKRKRSDKDEKNVSVKKARVGHSTRNVRQEKKHASTNPGKEEKKSGKKDEGKKEEKKDGHVPEVIWNDRNCDHDLDDHAASNVHTRKIKIAANLLLSCRMISHLENKNLHQDYAALVFSRKTNKEKTFDFMVDMRWTERIIQALNIIIQENPVFFNKKPVSALTQKS
jgi:hypothetical protein